MKRKHRDIYGWLLAGILAAVSIITGVMAVQQAAPPSSGEDEEPGQTVELGVLGEVTELNAAQFADLVAAKADFVVVAHMATCSAEFPLLAVAEEYAETENATLYALNEEEFKQTSLAETVKYLPSAAIYREGKLVRYLDAEKDEDVEYYKTVDGLRKWLTQE